MEKLFDETYGSDGFYSRTIWYGYIKNGLDESLSEEILELIKSDLENVPGETPNYTSWVFYDEKQSGDAIGDQVRCSFMIREQSGKYVANYNMSDYAFVTAYDSIEKFKEELLSNLNKR